MCAEEMRSAVCDRTLHSPRIFFTIVWKCTSTWEACCMLRNAAMLRSLAFPHVVHNSTQRNATQNRSPVSGAEAPNEGPKEAGRYSNDCTMNLQQGRQRRPRRWDASLLYGAFFVWVTISLVFAVRIFLIKGPTVTPTANGDTNINPQSLKATGERRDLTCLSMCRWLPTAL
jgi:hypothetical protein